jgi:opacity protein-like surface antigen
MSRLLRITQQALLLPGLIATCMTVSAEDHNLYVQFNAGAAFAPSHSTSATGRSCVLSGASGTINCGSFQWETTQDYDPGFVGSAALGYRIADNFRLEGELLYQNNENGQGESTITSNFYGRPKKSEPSAFFDSGERERIAYLLNGYYDFKNGTPFTPYITAGMGGYHLRLKSQDVSTENDLDFAWQAGAGINYQLNDQISFDLKYRYFGGADAQFDTRFIGNSPNSETVTSDYYDVGEHQILAGIRVGF